MKIVVKLCWLLMICGISVPALSQNPVKLICPLNDATVVPPPQNQMKWDVEDLCIVLVSSPDTVVKAVSMGKITNIEFTDEGGHGVVLFSRINNKEYYFWYTGMNKLLVKRNDVIKVGQALGFVTAGERIELTMYEFETPVDPIKFLSCTRVLRGF